MFKKILKEIILSICLFAIVLDLYGQDSNNEQDSEVVVSKQKYKFVFVFNDMACTNCYVTCVKMNVDNIQKAFRDSNACYVIMQVGQVGDAVMYRKLIKHATIIETTEKLDFSDCGVTKFPGLICYNEYGVPVKVYNDITQKAPFLHSKMFDELVPSITSEFRSVPLLEDDSVSYVSFGQRSAIFNDMLYYVDELTCKLHKIDINSGVRASSFNFNDTAITLALLEDEFRTSEYFKYAKNDTDTKIYSSFYTSDRIFVIPLSNKGYNITKEYSEEYGDTLITISNIPGFILVSLDTNFTYTYTEFDIDGFTNKTKHFYTWDLYFNSDVSNNDNNDNGGSLLLTLCPADHRQKLDTVYLLAKVNLSKTSDIADGTNSRDKNSSNDRSMDFDFNNYELFYPVINNPPRPLVDYVYTQKIMDSSSIFIMNSRLGIFSKIDNGNGGNNGNGITSSKITDFGLQGGYLVDTYKFKDSNINNAIKKSNRSNSLFLSELNDSLLITGLVYQDVTTSDLHNLCLQTYSKSGKFIKENIYNLEGVKEFHYSCIYNNNLVFIYRTGGTYNVCFIPLV